MTQHKEIQDLLYFKGNIKKYNIELNLLKDEEIDSNFKVILSILK